MPYDLEHKDLLEGRAWRLSCFSGTFDRLTREDLRDLHALIGRILQHWDVLQFVVNDPKWVYLRPGGA
jgi:hypothetical protein